MILKLKYHILILCIGLSLVLLFLLIFLEKKRAFDIPENGIPNLRFEMNNLDYLEGIFSQKVVVFSSSGGSGGRALELTNSIIRRDTEVHIFDKCLSACAEIILPAASKVKFIDEPLIGFHGNQIVFLELKKELSNYDDLGCSELSFYWYKEIYSHKDLNLNFWKEQDKRLKFSAEFIFFPNRTCPRAVLKSENDMWYPTSQQLKELWGLNFEGSVCADNPNCINNYIKNTNYLPGTRLVFGDTVYIVKASWRDKIFGTRDKYKPSLATNY